MFKLVFKKEGSMTGVVSQDRRIYWCTRTVAEFFRYKAVNYFSRKHATHYLKDVLPGNMLEVYSDMLSIKVISNECLLAKMEKFTKRFSWIVYSSLQRFEFSVTESHEEGLMSHLSLCSPTDPGAITFRNWMESKRTPPSLSPQYTPASPVSTLPRPKPKAQSPNSSDWSTSSDYSPYPSRPASPRHFWPRSPAYSPPPPPCTPGSPHSPSYSPTPEPNPQPLDLSVQLENGSEISQPYSPTQPVYEEPKKIDALGGSSFILWMDDIPPTRIITLLGKESRYFTSKDGK